MKNETMRIAFITNSFPSLSEKFIINQIVALQQLLGGGISILSSVPSSESATCHSLYSEHKLADITENLNIPRNQAKRLIKILAVAAPLLFTHPVLLARCFDSGRYGTMAKNMKLIFFLRFFLKKRRRGITYDTVHCQFGQNGFVGAYLRDAGFCRNFITTFHGSDINVFPRKHGRDVYAYPFLTAAAVTCGSRFIRGKLIGHGCPAEKIRVLPMGIFPEEYAPQTEETGRRAERTDGAATGEEDFTALSVGRLLPMKGFDYAIRAAAATGIRYVIAGGGTEAYTEQLRSLIASLNAGDRIVLAGAKIDSELKALYAQADCFLFPSVRAENGAEEGQGLVVQEAEAAGLPVIASDIGGVGEGMENGVTGFLVPEKDADAIAEKLRLLKHDARLRAEMGTAAARLARERYDCRKLGEQFVSLYRSVCAGSEGGGTGGE